LIFYNHGSQVHANATLANA